MITSVISEISNGRKKDMINFYKIRAGETKKISRKCYFNYLEAFENYEGYWRGWSKEGEEFGKISTHISFGDLEVVAVFDDWSEYEKVIRIYDNAKQNNPVM